VSVGAIHVTQQQQQHGWQRIQMPFNPTSTAYRTTRRQRIFKKSWNYYTLCVH